MKRSQWLIWTSLAALLVLAGCQSATDEKDDNEGTIASYTTASEAVKAKAMAGLTAAILGLNTADLDEGVPYDSETVDATLTISDGVGTISLTLTSFDVEGTTYTGSVTVTQSDTKNHWTGSLTLGGTGTGSVAFDLEISSTETTEGTVTTTTTFATGTFTVDGTKYSLENFTLDVDTEDSTDVDEE